MRLPHPQSHMTFQYCGHMTNIKRYISTFTRPKDPKFSRVVTQDDKTPSKNSRDTSIVWSRNKSKIFYLYFHKTQGPET